MEIIGILGFKGSGKDTAAQALLDNGFRKFAFADAVKDLLATTFCWDRTLLEGDTAESRAWREKVDPWWAAKLDIPNFSPRFALTHIGTDVMRKHFNDSVWIFNTERRAMVSGAQQVVFTDCRFPNEANAIKAMGGKLVRVARGPEPEFWQYSSVDPMDGSYEGAQTVMRTKYHHVHVSEWAWNNIAVDARIENDGTIDELKNNMLQLRLKWAQS